MAGIEFAMETTMPGRCPMCRAMVTPNVLHECSGYATCPVCSQVFESDGETGRPRDYCSHSCGSRARWLRSRGKPATGDWIPRRGVYRRRA